MTRWSDEENCISLPTLYVRDVDRIGRELSALRGKKVETEEFGEYLRPVIRLCKKSVNSRIGAVKYFIKCRAFKGIVVDHRKIESAVRKLQEKIHWLDSMTDELVRIDPERENDFKLSRTVASTGIFDNWEESECDIDQLICEIRSNLYDMVEAIDLIDLTLLKASVFTYKDYINHYND